MDARNVALRIVAIFVLVVGTCSGTIFASSVYTYASLFNLPIPAEQDNSKGWMDDAVIEVPDHFIIHDIDVGFSVSHTSAFDLQIFLQSPAGTQLCLNMYNFDEFFEGENYTNTIFDDEASLLIEQDQPPFTGRFKPRAGNLLEVFDGQDAFGSWRLKIYDAFYFDTGTLDSFDIMITAPEPATVALLVLGAALIRLFNRRR